MTLDQLRAFVAVAEREHLTNAAAALHLTPSAVSSAIHALEERYGAHLFDRLGRRIELSPDGRAFLTEARATLASAAASERVLKEFAGLARGALTIAASQTSATYWLPAILVAFRAAHPAISLTVEEGNTARVADAVVVGRADLGLIEGEIDRPAVAVRRVDVDRLVIVAAPNHPLVGARVEAEDLAAASWIMRERGSGTRTEFEQALQKADIAPDSLDIVLELPSNEAICVALRAGPHLAAVSELVARAQIEAGRLKALRYTLPIRHFAVLRHKERFKTRASLAFEALIDETVRNARSRLDPATFDI